MKKQVDISISILPIKSIDEAIKYVKSIQEKIDFVHCDVMDGVFVPRRTYDHNVVYNINQHCLSMLDVHLMVKEPFDLIDDYLNAGANILTVHYEAFANLDDLSKSIKKIKARGAMVGIAFCPNTPVSDIKLYCNNVDLIVVMGVDPGESGQKLLSGTVDKIKQLDKYRRENDLKFKIEVDGGVNGDNCQTMIDAGVDIIVSGNYVYKAVDRENALAKLRGN